MPFDFEKDAEITHLFNALLASHCKLPKIVISPLSSLHSGHFSNDTITLTPSSPSIQKTTLKHELVHAYDHCTKKFNILNAQHVACAEIRAVALSGECGFIQEMDRGYFSLKNGFRKCVKRRVLLSMVPHGFKDVDLETCVNGVFERCFADRAPFS